MFTRLAPATGCTQEKMLPGCGPFDLGLCRRLENLAGFWDAFTKPRRSRRHSAGVHLIVKSETDPWADLKGLATGCSTCELVQCGSVALEASCRPCLDIGRPRYSALCFTDEAREGKTSCLCLMKSFSPVFSGHQWCYNWTKPWRERKGRRKENKRLKKESKKLELSWKWDYHQVRVRSHSIIHALTYLVKKCRICTERHQAWNRWLKRAQCGPMKWCATILFRQHNKQLGFLKMLMQWMSVGAS